MTPTVIQRLHEVLSAERVELGSHGHHDFDTWVWMTQRTDTVIAAVEQALAAKDARIARLESALDEQHGATDALWNEVHSRRQEYDELRGGGEAIALCPRGHDYDPSEPICPTCLRDYDATIEARRGA